MSAPMNPTKGNLMAAKKSLDLAKVGFDLLDRKRNILIRETMAMIDSANEIQKQIDSTYAEAYRALQYANVTLGICDRAAQSVPIENGVNIGFRSVDGCGDSYGVLRSHANTQLLRIPIDQRYAG